MFKLFIAAGLVVLAMLPNTDAKLSLERSLRDKIDNTTTMSAPARAVKTEVNTAEVIEGLNKLTPQARAAYFIDTKSGQILSQKNAHDKLPMASLTKLMTAIVVIEQADLEDVVTVPPLDTHSGDATMGLRTGDKVTVQDLLQGLLINSGSDAALALANHVSGGQPEFVALMNEKTKILGLEDTQFTNPVGWDETGNYSTAHNLAILTKLALRNEDIAVVVKKPSATVRTVNGRVLLLRNTNTLLDQTRYLGAKTGTTFKAGECLAIYYKDNQKELVGVVLNSPNRFAESRNIINWITKNYRF